jgi:hypothetical protein
VLCELVAEGLISRRKRSREELEKDLNDWIREKSTLRVKRQRLPRVSRRVSRLNRKKENMENIGLETTDLTGEENHYKEEVISTQSRILKGVYYSLRRG